MSDEERKAIEWLKKADWFSARLYAPTILNLIEKQSKEIEELKENVKLRLQDIPLIEGELKAYKDRVNELKSELEKEKQAMQYFYNLRATIDESNMLFDEDIDVKCGKETIKQITIILNLIEKQSKEIEELKEDNKKKSIVIIEYQDLYEKLVDKIKAKIEECENKIKKIRSKKLINEPEDTIVITRYAHYISVLQSLLEKE